MNKKCKNHDIYFGYSSDSDDSVCVIKRSSSSSSLSSSSGREQSYPESSFSDKDGRLKKIHSDSSLESNSDVDTRTKFKIQTRKIPQKHQDKTSFNNRREKAVIMDGLNPCESVFTEIPAKRRIRKAKPPHLKRRRMGNRIKTEISKYPKVPSGVVRRRIRDEALIQSRVETNFPPCPGLEHVTEIRGLKQLIYFCDLCNASCVEKDVLHHLSGFKHQLNCFKALRPNKFETIKQLSKDEIIRYLLEYLSYIQDKEGIGRIQVEKDYLVKDNHEAENSSSGSLGIPGTSTDNPSIIHEEVRVPISIVPKLSTHDYFCLVCECSVNDIKMFGSHTKNGRLSSRVRQYPKNRAPKTVSVHMPSADAFLVDRVDDHDGPAIGLNYIREIQHVDDKKETYHCFLCGECLTCINIIQHTTAQKHRINYLERTDHHSLDLIRQNRYDENRLYYIVEEICRKIQKDVGAGRPEVYVIRKPNER